jgi:predicted nucleic-acid-binding protein
MVAVMVGRVSAMLACSGPARSTLEGFVAGKGNFADYVIKEHARAAGCDGVATFDRALLKEEGFVAP